MKHLLINITSFTKNGPRRSGLLIQMTHWLGNNKAKMTAITAALGETVSIIATGEIKLPEAPASIETMLASPELNKGKEQVRETLRAVQSEM